MKALWQWFLTNGDKLLAAATAMVGTLQASGVIKNQLATPILATLTFVHNTFLPEPAAPAPPPPQSKQGGFARPEMLLATLVLAALTAWSVGCSSLGLAPAQSFDEKLAYAYGTHTAVEQAAASAVTSHSITAAEGQAVLNLGDQARTLLDAAKTVEATNATGATKDLVLATAILAQLQQYLQARGVK